MQHFTKESIDEEGRVFLADRSLSIPVALQMGIASCDGFIGFPFVRNGEIVRTKFRNVQDKKQMRFSSVEDKDNFKIPFWNQHNWPTIDYLIITEGELDCVAISQLGALNCVSLPNGSGSVNTAFKNNYDYLQQFELIYVAFDMDEAGNKAAEEARKILPAKKYRRIMFPAKDANDWIRENPEVTKDDLDKLMRNAQKNIIEEIVHFRDLPETFFEKRDIGKSTGWESLDKFIGGIRSKELTVVSADTGAGKTTFCLNLLCNLLKSDRSGFWVNSWEMDYEVVVRKIASVVLGNKFKTEPFTITQQEAFKKWMLNHNAMINPKRSKADLPTLYKQIEIATRVYGVKYILLDHLDYISSTSKEKENHERVKEAIVGIHDMAMEFDVHIFLIAHPKQMEGGSGEMHMGLLKGSAAIKQYADNIILLQNMAQVDLSEYENRMKVSVPKNRFMGTKGKLTLRYDPESDSYQENSQINWSLNET